MHIETIWLGLYSCISMMLLLTTFTGCFYLCGRTLLTLLRLPTIESSSIVIATGMSSVLFIAWYAYKLGMPLSTVITSVFLLVAIYSSFRISCYFKSSSQYRLLIPETISVTSLAFPILSLVFSLQSLIAVNSPIHLVGTIANQDIYDWAMLAENLLGSAGYDNVIIGPGVSAQQHRIDSFGTFLSLAIFSKFLGKSPLEATPAYTIWLLSLIGLAIFDLVKKAFRFNFGVAIGIALLVVAGSFFYYLAYNNFYGQLLATFFYISTICSVLHIALTFNEMDFIERSFLSAISIIGILISYQAGFLVFLLFSITFCVVLGRFAPFSYEEKELTLTSRIGFLLIPLLVGTFFGTVSIPELALYTFQRSIEAKDAVSGWPLPLIFPSYLLALPSPPFPWLSGRYIHYVLTLAILCIVFRYTLMKVKSNGQTMPGTNIAFQIFFLLSASTYLFSYMLKGDIYQVWKFGAFVVLPMSFTFSSSILHFLLLGNSIKTGRKKYTYILLLICCTYFVIVVPHKLPLYTNSEQIRQFSKIKEVLSKKDIQNIALDAMDSREAMVAYNVFSDRFKLYSLVPTYSPPLDQTIVRNLNPEKTRFLVNAKCFSGSVDTKDDKYKILEFNDYYGVVSVQHLFDQDNRCNIVHGVILQDGFANSDPWGTWTEGNRARLIVNIPTAFIGKQFAVDFEVVPFGKEQSILTSVNTIAPKSWIIRNATTLNFVIPDDVSKSGKLEFVFSIKRPLSPKDLDPTSLDSRLLGLGFVSMHLYNAQ